MRIDLNQKLRDAGDIGNSESASTRAQANVPAKTNPGNDRAELSPDQVRVQSLASQTNDLPDVRQEKVSALGLAIQQGNYHVTPEQTATAMLDDMRFAA
jgi:flagellar biosynthesis anti-sigma factor FlgM